MDAVQARAILLASIMKADSTVRIEEMDLGRYLTLRDAERRNIPSADAQASWIKASHSGDLTNLALNVLRRLPEEDRATLIDDLWKMAACDAEVHTDETRLVLEYAEKLGVSAAPSTAPYLDSPHT